MGSPAQARNCLEESLSIAREIADRTGFHNYNYFRVETIDSFFQSILRNLARELGLKANLQVGLNDTEVESEAVDNIIENIQQENDPLLGWIMDFVQQKIGEDKNWNVISQIKKFVFAKIHIVCRYI